MSPERIAYWCPKCEPAPRRFIKLGEQVPRCPAHGRYVRQQNKPYLKKKGK